MSPNWQSNSVWSSHIWLFLIYCCWMFAFWLLSLRDWELNCPTLLLAESGSMWQELLSYYWLSSKVRGSVVAFRRCAPVPTGPLQNGVDWNTAGFWPLRTYEPLPLGQCVRAPTKDVINGGGAMWEVRTGLCACPLPGSGHWFWGCTCRTEEKRKEKEKGL